VRERAATKEAREAMEATQATEAPSAAVEEDISQD
jgi:hypothetical protein